VPAVAEVGCDRPSLAAGTTGEVTLTVGVDAAA
jgi:hypothetical protein